MEVRRSNVFGIGVLNARPEAPAAGFHRVPGAGSSVLPVAIGSFTYRLGDRTSVGVAEVWVLGWLGALQLAAALWWWGGPSLRQTRIAGTLLLGLNGVYTISSAVFQGTGTQAWPFGVRSFGWIDRVSDVALLAVILVAGGVTQRRARVSLAIILCAAILIGLTLPFYLNGPEGDHPNAIRLAREAPLILSVAFLGLAVRHRTLSSESDAWPWTIVVSAIGLRLAEIVPVYFLPRLTQPDSYASLWSLAHTTALVLAIAAASYHVTRTIITPGLREKTQGWHRMTLAVAFLGAGVALGMGRREVIPPDTYLLASLAFVRPISFVAARAMIGSRSVLGDHALRATLVTLMAAFVGLAGILFGRAAWGLGASGALFVAAAVTLLLIGILVPLAAHTRARSTAANRQGAERPSPLITLEADRVPLPDDWAARVRDNFQAYGRLPRTVAEGLDRMPRWQRILLALHAIEDHGPPYQYEASTPGLHLTTHCPYAAIGTEIARLNGRARDVLHEFGIGHDSDIEPQLIRSMQGRAMGLRSGRAKIYALTGPGRATAERVMAQMGIAGIARADLSRVIGERFGIARAGAGPPTNPR